MNNSKHLIWIGTGMLVGFLAAIIFGELLNLPSGLLYYRQILSAPLKLMLLFTSLRFFIHQKQNFSHLLIENRRTMRNVLAAEREDRFHPHRGRLDYL